ncbi:MAG TPA: response regulator transcription factor [Parafilimonas sp.]
MGKKICYIICEDNNDYRESLLAFLDEDNDLVCCGSFTNAENILDKIKTHQPDVVLMDIDMPGKNGIEALKEIKEFFPETEIIMLTVFEDRDNVFEAVCAGASGYLLKNSSPEVIAKSIKEVIKGGAAMTPAIARKTLQFFQKPLKGDDFKLTAHEQQVLKLLVDGLSYKMIAAKMDVVIDTIRYHIKKIYEKLHVHSAPEAVAKAIRDKLV